jgi:hypothetical protein
MKSNHLPTSERVKLGKNKEAKIVGVLMDNGYPMSLSSQKEDMEDKIDAWWYNNSVQIKYREDREDFGVALIKPWLGNQHFIAHWMEDRNGITLDRDLVAHPDYYVCASNKGIIIVSGSAVRTVCYEALDEFYWDNGFLTKSYKTYIPFSGVEIKLVTDKWDGREKIIAYLSFDFLNTKLAGVFLDVRI